MFNSGLESELLTLDKQRKWIEMFNNAAQIDLETSDRFIESQSKLIHARIKTFRTRNEINSQAIYLFTLNIFGFPFSVADVDASFID